MGKIKERQSNIELLRIVAMLMIVGHHLAIHGVQHYMIENDAYILYSLGSTFNKILVSVLLPGGEIGVAVFFIITGYFNILKTKVSAVKVIVESMHYAVIAFLLFVFCYFLFGGVSTLPFVKAMTYLIGALVNPGTSGRWWFVTAYILLIEISPLLNNYLNKFTKKGYVILIICYAVIWYASPYFYGGPLISYERAMFFYIIGAFIRLHCTKKDRVISFVISGVLMWGVGVAVMFFISELASNRVESTTTKLLVNSAQVLFSTVVVPICACCIFRTFECVNIGYNKIVNNLASTTFGVYLIHDSLIGRHFLWYDLLKIDNMFVNNKMFFAWVIPIILGVFISCSMIDLIRIKVFERKEMEISKKVMNEFEKLCTKK